MESNIGKKVIIRGDRSGVEFGTLVEYKGSEVTLHNAVEIIPCTNEAIKSIEEVKEWKC